MCAGGDLDFCHPAIGCYVFSKGFYHEFSSLVPRDVGQEAGIFIDVFSSTATDLFISTPIIASTYSATTQVQQKRQAYVFHYGFLYSHKFSA